MGIAVSLVSLFENFAHSYMTNFFYKFFRYLNPLKTHMAP